MEIRIPAPSAKESSPWHWLLLVVIVVPLLTPLYNRTEPRLLGIPFFYWCQIAFAGLVMVAIGVIHLATSDRRGR